MNSIDKMRKVTELNGEFSKLTGKIEALEALLQRDYFANLILEGRNRLDPIETEEDVIRAGYHMELRVEITQSCIGTETWEEWNTINRAFIPKVIAVLKSQQQSIKAQLLEVVENL